MMMSGSVVFFAGTLLLLLGCKIASATPEAGEQEQENKNIVPSAPSSFLSQLQLEPQAWMQCIDGIFDYHTMGSDSPTDFTWKRDNPCGFQEVTPEILRQELFFSPARGTSPDDSIRNPDEIVRSTKSEAQRQSTRHHNGTKITSSVAPAPSPEELEAARREISRRKKVATGAHDVVKSITIAGDSTLKRFELYSLNKIFNRNHMYVGIRLEWFPPISSHEFDMADFPPKVGDSENHHRQGDEGGGDSEVEEGEALSLSTKTGRTTHGKRKKKRKTEFRFYKVRYVMDSYQNISTAIKNSIGGGPVIFTLGYWDMEFLLHRVKEGAPGVMCMHNVTCALEMWAIYSTRFFQHITRALREFPPDDPMKPMVMIRDTFLPYCFTHRFRHRKWRDCNSILRPLIIPLFRRTIHTLAWSLGIPVIPVDPLFTKNYKYCNLQDGVHLDHRTCYDHMQQIMWNSALFMDRLNRGYHEDRRIEEERRRMQQVKRKRGGHHDDQQQQEDGLHARGSKSPSSSSWGRISPAVRESFRKFRSDDKPAESDRQEEVVATTTLTPEEQRQRQFTDSGTGGGRRGQGYWQDGISGKVIDLSQLAEPDELMKLSPLRSPHRVKPQSMVERRRSKKTQEDPEQAAEGPPEASNPNQVLFSKDWPITAFWNPAHYDNWRSKAFPKRPTPGGVDTKHIWLCQPKEDSHIWMDKWGPPAFSSSSSRKRGSTPPVVWDPQRFGGAANYTEEMHTVATWFSLSQEPFLSKKEQRESSREQEGPILMSLPTRTEEGKNLQPSTKITKATVAEELVSFTKDETEVGASSKLKPLPAAHTTPSDDDRAPPPVPSSVERTPPSSGRTVVEEHQPPLASVAIDEHSSPATTTTVQDLNPNHLQLPLADIVAISLLVVFTLVAACQAGILKKTRDCL